MIHQLLQFFIPGPEGLVVQPLLAHGGAGEGGGDHDDHRPDGGEEEES